KIANEFGADIHHVKLHGALYHQADADPKIACAVARVIQATLPQAMIYASPHARMQLAARELGMGFRAEGFVDRRYCDDGSLVPREQSGAVMHDPTDAVAQVMEILSNGRVTGIGGVMIPITIDTLCVHGDNESALEILRSIHKALNAAGVRVCH
ncbi:MAG: LamB/YcsF family protein, partial [Luteolibacter sp.]